MKKFIMLSALVAATSTAFVACSSDDDLAQQPKAPETIVDTPKGTPFSVVVNNEDGSTRATLIDGTTLANFKLFAKQEGASDSWINGNVFKYEDPQWKPYNAEGTAAVGDLTWPTENTSKASTFYAYSDNSSTGVTVNASPTTSCITTDNLATGSFVYQMYKDPDDHVLVGGNGYSSVSSGTNMVVKLGEQSDLLVASASQSEADNSGVVPLNFRHALSSLAFQARFTNKENNVTTGVSEEAAYAKIFWIRVIGLKGGGTFTFNDTYNTTTKRWGTSPWTSDGGTEVIYEKVFGDNEDDLTPIPCQTHVSGDITKTPLVSHTEMLVVPQTFTPWACNGEDVAIANCYLQICMIIRKYKDIDENDYSIHTTPLKRKSCYYLPLKIPSTSNEFQAGVKHTITLNLNYITNSDGMYQLSPSQAGGARSYDWE